MTSQDKDMQSRLKDALLALQKMRAKVETLERAKSEPIAIIGRGFYEEIRRRDFVVLEESFTEFTDFFAQIEFRTHVIVGTNN